MGEQELVSIFLFSFMYSSSARKLPRTPGTWCMRTRNTAGTSTLSVIAGRPGEPVAKVDSVMSNPAKGLFSCA